MVSGCRQRYPWVRGSASAAAVDATTSSQGNWLTLVGAGACSTDEHGRMSPDVTPAAPPAAGTGRPGAPPGANGDSPPPAPRRRRGGTARDMVISLTVLGLVVAGYLLVSGLWRNVAVGRGTPQAPAVDVVASASAKAQTARFPLVAPTAVPSGWRARQAAMRVGGVWHLEFVTPADRFAAVDQAAGPAAQLLAETLPGRRPTGAVQLASGRWQEFAATATAGGASRSGLVQQRGTTTVVVSGTADDGALRTLAGTLADVG